MSYQATIAALVAFAFVSSITPGPNNLMLLASGVNFGFRRTLPHLLGVSLGFSFMVFLIGLGIGQIFVTFPSIYLALKWIGVAYLLWLAWKIANSGPISGDADSPTATPMTFLQAAAFQWINPKAWVMGVTAVATYVLLAEPFLNAVVVAILFGVINLPSVSVWVLFGTGMRRLLADPAKVRVFNWIMAGLLVASLWPIFAEML